MVRLVAASLGFGLDQDLNSIENGIAAGRDIADSSID
jgi:hypothetical protein